jgi:uncharacterized protein (DUF433 family)
MTLTLAADPLPLRLDAGGTYRVGQTRVRLDTVVFAYNAGSSAEQITRDYPGLELADVHSVIGYYLHHKPEVDAYLQQREREAEELKRAIEAEPHNRDLRQKILDRWQQRA